MVISWRCWRCSAWGREWSDFQFHQTQAQHVVCRDLEACAARRKAKTTLVQLSPPPPPKRKRGQKGYALCPTPRCGFAKMEPGLQCPHCEADYEAPSDTPGGSDAQRGMREHEDGAERNQ